MRTPHFFWAVYGIIRNSSGKILFGKRKNTGYEDGKWQLPAGHIEPGETPHEALIRELYEEVGIIIRQDQLDIRHIAYRKNHDRETFDIYMDVLDHTGEIHNAEPEKCEALAFLDIHTEERSQFIEHTRMVFSQLHTAELTYSEWSYQKS